MLSLRASAHTGVAMSWLEGKCTEKYHEKWDSPRFLVVIVTWFHSTGGLPRQFANWLAMTAYLYKHQYIFLFGFVLGIDFFGICAKVWVKSRDGDTRAGKILREGAVWWKASGCLPGSYRS